MVDLSGGNHHSSNGSRLGAWEQHARWSLLSNGWQEALARVLSASIAAVWSGLDEASFIRRELVVLLLEDPNFRMRVTHAEASLQQRLPSLLMVTCTVAHSTNFDCWSPAAQHQKPFLQSVVLSDPAACNLFTLVPACYPPKPSSVVHLNLQQLVQHAIARGHLSLASAAILLPELLHQQASSQPSPHNAEQHLGCGFVPHPPPPPPAPAGDRRQPPVIQLAPESLAALEATWPVADVDSNLLVLCAYVLLAQGQCCGAPELPLRDLLVWLELLLPLDTGLAHHPILVSASCSRQAAGAGRQPAFVPALLDFLVTHPSSKGCFRIQSHLSVIPGASNAGEPMALPPRNSIAAAASASLSAGAQPDHGCGPVVALVVEKLARSSAEGGAVSPGTQQQQQHQQRRRSSRGGLEAIAELLPAWDRLRCSPRKAPFAGTDAAAGGAGAAGSSPRTSEAADATNRSTLPQFLFDFERAATAAAVAAHSSSFPRTPPSPTPFACRSTSGAPATAPAGLSLSLGHNTKGGGGGGGGGGRESSRATPTSNHPASGVLPAMQQRSSDPGGIGCEFGEAIEPAVHANGIPCRRSPTSFAGRLTSGGSDLNTQLEGAGGGVCGAVNGIAGSPGGGGLFFGGRSFPGDFGQMSPLFPGSLMEVSSTEVPLEIASCWGGGTGTSPSASHTRAERGLGLGLGGEHRPLSLSLPTRQTPAAALGSAFSPSGATDPCLRSDSAAAAAAAAAGLVGSPVNMQDRLPNTLSDPTTSPWSFGLGSSPQVSAPFSQQRGGQQHKEDAPHRRASAAGDAASRVDISRRSADAMLGVSFFGNPRNSTGPQSAINTCSPYNSGSLMLSGSPLSVPAPATSNLGMGHMPGSAAAAVASMFGSAPDTHTPLPPAHHALAGCTNNTAAGKPTQASTTADVHPPSSSLGSSVNNSGPRGRLSGMGPGGDPFFGDSVESCSQHPSPSSTSEHDSEFEVGGLSLGSNSAAGRSEHSGSKAALLSAGAGDGVVPALPAQQQTKQQQAQQLRQQQHRGSSSGGGADLEQALEAIMQLGSPTAGQARTHPAATSGDVIGGGATLAAAGRGGPKSFAAAARAGGPGPQGRSQSEAGVGEGGGQLLVQGGGGATGGELERAMMAYASNAGVSTTALAAATAAAAANGRAMTGWAAVAAKKGGGDGGELDPIYEPSEQQQQQQQQHRLHALSPMSSPVVGSPLAATNSTGSSVNALLQHPHQQQAQALGLGAMALPTGGPGSLPTLAPSSKASKGPNMLATLQQQQQQQAGGQVVMGPGGVGGGGRLESRTFARLSPKLRMEVHRLLSMVPGLKLEDFDDGVVYQLAAKKSEEEALGALRTLAENDVSGIQHLAAYINHVIKNYHVGSGLEGGTVTPSAAVRASPMPVSSKAILQKLPLKVYKRLEDIVNNCSYMEWKHFDAGVIKVMGQLSDIGEEDVFEELDLLEHTDLSNVEYMPAYLNKRLNNRLWSRRKGHQLH